MDAISLTAHIRTLHSDTSNCDVILEAVEEGQGGEHRDIPCHMFAVIRSNVFRRALEGPFKEGVSRKIRIPVKKIKYAEALKQLLYMDEIDLGGEWELDDVVHLMSLCDRYELGHAFKYAAKKISGQLSTVSLVQAQETLDQLSNVVGRQALNYVWKELKMPAVSLGDGMVSHLVWLTRLHRRTGMAIDKILRSCLDNVGVSKASLDREIEAIIDCRSDRDVMQVTMLITSKLVENMWKALPDSYYACSGNQLTKFELNKTEKAALEFSTVIVDKISGLIIEQQTE